MYIHRGCGKGSPLKKKGGGGRGGIQAWVCVCLFVHLGTP